MRERHHEFCTCHTDSWRSGTNGGFYICNWVCPSCYNRWMEKHTGTLGAIQTMKDGQMNLFHLGQVDEISPDAMYNEWEGAEEA